MTVSQAGSVNLTSVQVPDVIVKIQPPQQNFINGVPSNILGLVGTAQWGPVNSPTVVGSLAQYVAQFGNIQARKYDIGTALWAATLNGANNFRVVRVTDGTDTAATATIGSTGVTITSKYTGSLGALTSVVLQAGTAANSWRVIVTIPGLAPEVFDNLAAGLTANAVWVAIAAAINNGISGLRGPSNIIVATAGASTAAPVVGTTALTGGTDGATTITSTVLLGTDGTTRTGMYALRSTGCGIAALVDCDTSTSWTTQVAYGLSEGTYMIAVAPAGCAIANGTTGTVDLKATAAIDSYTIKILHGDWCYFNDTVNNQIRLISPQGFAAGRLAGLSPQESGLNKPLYGIVGTQKSYTNTQYSNADLTLLAQAGIDVITNPIPAGASFGLRTGRNASSNAVINGDNYPRMTNYVAYTLNSAMGIYVGRLQTTLVRQSALGAVNAFLAGMWQQGMIGDVTNAGKQPWSAICDGTNNSAPRVALGYMQIDLRITYLSVITTLLINVEGGQSVSVNVSNIQQAPSS